MRNVTLSMLGFVAAVALLASPAMTQTSQHAFYWSQSSGFIDIGVLNGGSYAAAMAINDSGVVAGYSIATNSEVAFKWTVAGGFQILPDLGLGAEAFAINSQGEVTGFVRTPGVTSHVAKWLADGTLVDLGTLGGNGGAGLAINDQGDVAGNSYTASNSSDAFLWTSTAGFRDIATKGYAYGLNKFEIAVGQYVPQFYDQPFVWTANHGVFVIGRFGGGNASAYAINNSGQVVGYFDTMTNGVAHAFVWSPSRHHTRDLGTLGAGKVSVANAINSLGQIAGFSSTSDNSATHAVVWDGKGGIVDLGTLSGGINSYAYGINVQGAVVGSSQVLQ